MYIYYCKNKTDKLKRINDVFYYFFKLLLIVKASNNFIYAFSYCFYDNKYFPYSFNTYI